MEIAILQVPKHRSIAEEYHQSYGEGVLEVSIDEEIYNQVFAPHRYRYDEKDGYERVEIVIPQRLFPILNQFPRALKPR